MKIGKKRLTSKHYVIGLVVLIGLFFAYKKGLVTKFFSLFKKKTA